MGSSINPNELPFIGRAPGDVKRFVEDAFSGHTVGACELCAVNVSTNGIPGRNMRAGVRALSAQTLQAVQLLRVMSGSGRAIKEFVVLELDAATGPLRHMAEALPDAVRGSRRLYTALSTDCFTEGSVNALHQQLGAAPEAS